MNGETNLKQAYESILHGDFEQAIVWFEQAIQAEPDNADYYYRCSITCARSGKWSKALLYAQTASDLDSNQAEFLFHLNTIKAKMLVMEAVQRIEGRPQQLHEAIAQLSQAVELDSLNIDAYVLLGIACGELLRFEEAAEHLREALRLNPQLSEAKRLLAEYKRRSRSRFSRLDRRIQRRNR